jgi:hypothetical protein
MDIRQINDEYSVTGQISVEDLDAIKALGFKSIVCHRPDFEQPDQPQFETIAAKWSMRWIRSSARCSATAAPAPARPTSISRPSIFAAETFANGAPTGGAPFAYS